MYSSTLLPSLLAATIFTQNAAAAGGLDKIAVAIFGYPSNITDVQASVVSFADSTGVVALSCSDCPLTPSPTLTVEESGYRLNLGTVATQTCTQASPDEATAITAVCTQSTSGVDQTSQTVTYSGDAVHFARITITAGLDLFSSAVSSFNATRSHPATSSTRNVDSTFSTASSSTGSLSTASSSSSNSITAAPSTTGSATDTATSGLPKPTGGAAGIKAMGNGIGVVGVLVGTFACLLL